MKKSLFNILCIVLCGILLAGCGAVQGKRPEKVNIRKVVNIELDPLSDEQSREMMNFMSESRACTAENRLYTADFDENYQPCLASYEINGKMLSDFRILVENCMPEFMTEYDGSIYYLNTANGRSVEKLSPDGSREVLNSGPCDFLRVTDGSLYYCDSRQRLCKSGLDGTGEQIVMPEACFYPYVLGDKLLYQKARNEHLYLYDFADGSDMEITDIPAYAPVIIRDRLYCTLTDGIYSADLEGMSPVKYELAGIQGTVEYGIRDEGITISGIMDSNGIYSFSFDTENVKDSFKKIPTGGYTLREFAGADCSVYTVFEPSGRIKNFLYTSGQETELRYIKGEIR